PRTRAASTRSPSRRGSRSRPTSWRSAASSTCSSNTTGSAPTRASPTRGFSSSRDTRGGRRTPGTRIRRAPPRAMRTTKRRGGAREAHGIEPLAAGEELSGGLELADPAAGAGGVEDDAALADRLLLVSDRTEVAPLVVRLATHHARTAALFAVRDGVIQGVLAGGAGPPRRIDTIYGPAAAESMLAGPARGEVFYGAPPSAGIDAALVEALGGQKVREVAVLPISVRGRVVQLLYVDNGREPLEAASLSALGPIADAMRSAWSRLIGESTQAHC